LKLICDLKSKFFELRVEGFEPRFGVARPVEKTFLKVLEGLAGHVLAFVQALLIRGLFKQQKQNFMINTKKNQIFKNLSS
jgi:hypothetical protein